MWSDTIFQLQSLQQKEKEDDQLVVKLQNEQAYLLSRLVELGAAGYVESVTSEAFPMGCSLPEAVPDVVNGEIVACPTDCINNSVRGMEIYSILLVLGLNK